MGKASQLSELKLTMDEKKLVIESIKISIKNDLLSETGPKEEQYIRVVLEVDQRLDKKLSKFCREFIRASDEKRKEMFFTAEKTYGKSDNEYEIKALKIIKYFFGPLFVQAVMQDGEYRGA